LIKFVHWHGCSDGMLVCTINSVVRRTTSPAPLFIRWLLVAKHLRCARSGRTFLTLTMSPDRSRFSRARKSFLLLAEAGG
jgi:hypothetical protein